jgi:hypothetical protein
MFQYAAARALSLRSNNSFKLDISGIEHQGVPQRCELNRIFKCHFEVASRSDIRKVLGWQSFPLVRRIMSRAITNSLRHDRFVVEPHFQFWPELSKAPRNCYLVGYWQSEKYFQDAESVIRNDFMFRNPLSNRNAELAEHIGKVNGVSLHVRRGDYASNPKITAMHGLCTLDYYRAAIQYVSERVAQPHFYVFSDDMAWAKANLKVEFPCQYVEHNKGTESYNDMRLMSQCRHHIIANSSFSWWGAWLNPSTTKVVIAPKNWFAKQTDVSDLYPAGWVTL